jgi:hypothetical protein
MSKPKQLWATVGPFGEFVGKCCDNCHHFWQDGATASCDLGRALFDDQPVNPHVDWRNDNCIDWVSAYVSRNKQQPTLI